MLVDEANVQADGEDVRDAAQTVLRRVEHGLVGILGDYAHSVDLQNRISRIT